MYISRIIIKNFRNFQYLDVALKGNIVIVGENRVGKSNLLFGLRLIFDPSLPDSSRQLGMADFWDGLEEIDADTVITRPRSLLHRCGRGLTCRTDSPQPPKRQGRLLETEPGHPPRCG